MSDYEATKRQLKDAKGWDVPGLIEDIRNDTIDRPQALAVIDTLMESMADICKLIHYKHAKRIDTDTIAKAATIAAKFVREPT